MTDHRAITDPSLSDPDAAGLPSLVLTSVWVTGQRSGPVQRRGRYVSESTQHPARMLPAIAAHAIAAYTEPGDLVLDPMYGIGTTLVEAAHLGRDATGVEFEGRWADVAAANIRLAHAQGATGRAMVVRGDATTLTDLIPAALHGRFALVVTSPPYGRAVHGLVRPTPGRVVKSANRYSTERDRGNLAHRDLAGLVDGFTQILRSCRDLLRPGGTVVVTARPWRHQGELVDLPSQVVAAGAAAGLVAVERCVALLAALRDGRLVPRPSFFQLHQVRKAIARGVPMHVIAHEDVLVLRRRLTSRSSAEPKHSQGKPEDGLARSSHVDTQVGGAR
jgi:hypothetical protein